MSEVEQIILPEGFKRVEYLQSTGNEVIYTGIIPTDKHGFYAEVESLGGTGYACGTQTEGYTPGFWIYVSDGVLYASYEDNNKTSVSSGIIKNNFLNDRKLISGTSIVKNYSQDFTYNWSYEFTLFKSTYTANTIFDTVVPIKIYRFKISENEKIIRDFVPCLDVNDTPCMYDLVNDEVYYNQGDGHFNYPRNYPSSNYNLPTGFKKCIYLQSDGTQWIDTGVIPDNETGIYFKALQMSGGDLVPFGVNEGGNWIYPPRFNSKDLYYRWGGTPVKMELTWDKADDLIFHSSLNLYNSKIAKFDSEDTDVKRYITSQTGTYTLPIWLFSCNCKGSYDSYYGKWGGRIYRAQITQRDSLIHDYVPCLDADNRPCMYDLIEQEVLYNQSGGTEFTYCVEHQLPSDFGKLKYLESSGTQYIKTDYVPTNTTGLYIDTQDIGSGDAIPMGLRESSSTNTRFFITRQTASHSAGYGWGAWINLAGAGSVRYYSTLNWLNDRKSITNSPLFATAIKNLGDLPFTPSLDIWMFGINQGGSHAYKFKGRIYRAKISEGTEVVRDFVPAWDDRRRTACMYDLINNVAYYNDGTGEFLHNRDYEGTYKGYTGLGCIGNRLGSDYNPVNEKLPSGYTRVEFLEALSNKSWIQTGLISNKLNISITASHHYAFSGDGNVVAGSEYGGVRYKIAGNTGKSAAWVFQDEGVTEWAMLSFPTMGDIWNIKVNFESLSVEIKSKSNSKTTPFHERYRELSKDLYFVLFKCGGEDLSYNVTGNGGAKNVRIYNFSANYDGITNVIDLICAIDTNGTPCMYDLVTGKSFYNSGTEPFVAGLKTISHALQLRLPNNSGTITLSLPTNDNIEYYEEKIRANNPTWTISFQYH